MEGMGLKFTPATGRCLLCHSSIFEPMAGTSGTHSQSKQSQQRVQSTSSFPSTPSTHPPPIMCYQWYYSGFEKNCSNSSGVSQLAEIVTQCQLKDCSNHTVYLAWLQSSTRELQWLQHLKSVFLKLPNVTTWSVFQDQITYKSYIFNSGPVSPYSP